MMSQYHRHLPEEREDEDRDDHHVEEEGRAAADVEQAVALHRLRLERIPGLVGVDRLVLGRVVLEDAAQVRPEGDERQVGDEDRNPDQPFDDHEPGVARRAASSRCRAGETLKRTIAKPIAMANAKMSCVRVSSGPARRPRAPPGPRSSRRWRARESRSQATRRGPPPPRTTGSRSQRCRASTDEMG